MARRRRTSDDPERPRRLKKVPVRIIDRELDGEVLWPYDLMEELIEKHHPHLEDARIALAWHAGWKEDADGLVRLGKCRKASDLDRELHEFDFVILLNHGAFNEVGVLSAQQQRAILDHELCHAQVRLNQFDDAERDERNRLVTRTRKHDLEEFLEVVRRHGCYTVALEKLVAAAMRAKRRPLLGKLEEEEVATDDIPEPLPSEVPR